MVISSEGWWVLPQGDSRRCCHGPRRERLPQASLRDPVWIEKGEASPGISESSSHGLRRDRFVPGRSWHCCLSSARLREAVKEPFQVQAEREAKVTDKVSLQLSWSLWDALINQSLQVDSGVGAQHHKQH